MRAKPASRVRIPPTPPAASPQAKRPIRGVLLLVDLLHLREIAVVATPEEVAIDRVSGVGEAADRSCNEPPFVWRRHEATHGGRAADERAERHLRGAQAG